MFVQFCLKSSFKNLKGLTVWKLIEGIFNNYNYIAHLLVNTFHCLAIFNMYKIKMHFNLFWDTTYIYFHMYFLKLCYWNIIIEVRFIHIIEWVFWSSMDYVFYLIINIFTEIKQMHLFLMWKQLSLGNALLCLWDIDFIKNVI